MNYNRYLDIHLCTNTDLAAVKLKHRSPDMYFQSNQVEHFYEFTPDLMRQLRYREAKTEGFTFNETNSGNCRILNGVELTDAPHGFLRLTSTLDTTGGGRRVSHTINDQLKQLRYIGCMVSIEKLRTNAVYEQLQALMLWISEPSHVNKLRINCHGDGQRTGVMSMGEAELSPAELVDALVRHGLTRPSTYTATVLGLAVGARWKLDGEKDACEKCNKNFSVFRRRHHCRRCGGLFCDACSSKTLDLAVALTGEPRGGVVQQTATAKNVKKARVCDTCYAAVAPVSQALAEDAVLKDVFGGQTDNAATTNYGLKTLALALCMGAKAGDEFSPERAPPAVGGQQPAAAAQNVGTFLSDSLAARFLAELRRHRLRGIRVTASNQVLAGSDEGLEAVCGVDFPTNTRTYFDPAAGQLYRTSTERNRFAKGQGTFNVPAYIWGSRQSLQRDYARLATPHAPARNAAVLFSEHITVSPCSRSLYFSNCASPTLMDTVLRNFLAEWKFTSWQKSRCALPAQPGGLSQSHTWKITAPPRVTRITAVPGTAGMNDNVISITGRETEYFKHYKSYEES